MTRYNSIMKWAGLFFICLLFSSVIQAKEEEPPWVVEAQSLGLEVWNARPTAFRICPEPDKKQPQAYALCASAQCFTINNVAYCKCIQKVGSSISLPFFFTNNQPPAPGPIAGDVCDLMDVSDKGDFLVSTFSPPPQLQQSYKGPDALAIYTCPNPGNLSAQCDGGLCFKGTSGTDWPYLGAIREDEIVCSCPIAASPKLGFQFIGPADCDRGFFEQYCGIKGGGSEGTSVSTGTQLAVGAVTGSGTILTKLLQGNVPPTNRCFFPLDTGNNP